MKKNFTFKITVLGSGTSTGIPVIGCSCSVCKSNKLKNKRTRSSIAITTYKGFSFVIDTTPEFRLQLLKAHIDMIEGVLYTHLHADHCMGFDDLRVFNFNKSQPLFCGVGKEHYKAFKEKFSYVFKDTKYKGSKPKVNLFIIDTKQKFDILGLEVEAIKLPHGETVSYGFKINNFAYVTDFKAFDDKQIQQWQNKIDVMIASGIHFGVHNAHSVIPETIELFQKLNIKKGYITHLDHKIDHYRDGKKLPHFVQFAYDNLKIYI